MSIRWRAFLTVATAVTVTAGVGAAPTESAALVAVDPVVPVLVPAGSETVPVAHSGDAADDPTIWVNRADPARSLVIGNDKRGALEVYELDGTLRQRLTTTFAPLPPHPVWGNSDIRHATPLAGATRDVVAVWSNGLRVYEMNPATRLLRLITDEGGSIPTEAAEGVCLHRDRADRLYAFVVRAAKGRVRQYLLRDADADGLVDGTLVRQFLVGSEAEGCVVDDLTGALYLSQEDVALWRYSAAPDGGSTRTRVDALYPDGHLRNDIEGLTLVDTSSTRGPGSGYLIVSAQYVANAANSYFAVYDRASNGYLFSFRISRGPAADACERTDGIAAYAGPLGARFPFGVFVCQDNGNRLPETAGNQNFKLTRLERIVPVG